MTGIVLMLVLAVTVEGIVQYIKSIIEMVTKKDYKTAVTQLSALVISVALCLMAGADVYGALGVTFAGGWAGMVLTGVFASRGANYAADIIKRLQGAKTGKQANRQRESRGILTGAPAIVKKAHTE